MDKKQNFEQVITFDLQAIQKAFHEGRLYIQPSAPTEAEVRAEGIRQILQYVSRIDACASEHYHNHIHQLWVELLHSQLTELFFFSRYSVNRGLPNWYRVTVIVCLLLECGVYDRQKFTAVQLHLMLEQTDKRNGRYTGMNRYLLEHHDLMEAKRIIEAQR